jgi:hypothetical protein
VVAGLAKESGVTEPAVERSGSALSWTVTMTSEDMIETENKPLFTKESSGFFIILDCLVVIFILAGAISIGIMLYSVLQFLRW